MGELEVRARTTDELLVQIAERVNNIYEHTTKINGTLGRHEERLQALEKTDRVQMASDICALEKRLQELEKWRWTMLGAFGVLAVLLPFVNGWLEKVLQ